MIFTSVLLVVLAATILTSAAFAVGTGGGERSRAVWLLVASLALAVLFALLGATAVALALVLVAAGQGLVLFYFVHALEIDMPDPAREAPKGEAARGASPASHWFLIVLGIGGGSFMASVVWRTHETASLSSAAGEHAPALLAGFAEVARIVIVEHGFATILVGLILLAAAVAAGFLVSREAD